MRLTATPFIIAAITGITLCISASIGWGQGAYPIKLVRIVNPVAAGGNQDVVARAYGEQFSKNLGQPFVIENRPGNSATAA